MKYENDFRTTLVLTFESFSSFADSHLFCQAQCAKTPMLPNQRRDKNLKWDDFAAAETLIDRQGEGNRDQKCQSCFCSLSCWLEFCFFFSTSLPSTPSTPSSKSSQFQGFKLMEKSTFSTQIALASGKRPEVKTKCLLTFHFREIPPLVGGAAAKISAKTVAGSNVGVWTTFLYSEYNLSLISVLLILITCIFIIQHMQYL